MQLTKHTDYAFRVLIYLASRSDSHLATIEEISTRFGVSKNHLMKVVQKLAHGGFLETLRGQQGGIRLGQRPTEITLRAVVEQMEQTLAPVNCLEPHCALLQHCRLKGLLFEAQEKFLAHLEQKTLAELVQPLPWS